LATALGTATQDGAKYSSTSSSSTTGFLNLSVQFIVPKRTAPTIVIYDGTGASGVCTRGVFGVSNSNGQTVASQDANEFAFLVYSSGSSNSGFITFQFTASSEL
jgi:hypothetical protein